MVLTRYAWATIVTSVQQVSYDLPIKTWHSSPRFFLYTNKLDGLPNNYLISKVINIPQKNNEKSSGTLFKRILFICVGFLLLQIGGYIYIAYRTTSLRLFHILNSFNASDFVLQIRMQAKQFTINEFVLYALPDGLWTVGYIIIMIGIWPRYDKMQFLFCSIIPLIGILSEIGQFICVVPGTADWADLGCYGFPYILYLIVLNHHKLFNL